MMDWLGRMLHLPEEFLFSGKDSRGGGVIQVQNISYTFEAYNSSKIKAFTSGYC